MDIKLDTKIEAGKPKEFRDNLPLKMNQVVSQMAEFDLQLGNRITDADQKGALTPPESEYLQQERKSCLDIALKGASRLTPDFAKGMLWWSLERTGLEQRYIKNLDSDAQAGEIHTLVNRYQDKLYGYYYRDGRDSREAEVDKFQRTFEDFILVTDKVNPAHGDRFKLENTINRIANYDNAGRLLGDRREEVVTNGLKFAIRNCSPIMQAEIASTYILDFKDAKLDFMTEICAEGQKTVVVALEKEHYFRSYERIEQGVRMVANFNGEAKDDSLQILASSLGEITDNNDIPEQITLARKILDLASADNRKKIILLLTKGDSIYEYRVLGSIYDSESEIISKILQLTDNSDERDDLFFRTARSNSDYRGYKEIYDVEAVIGRAEITPVNSAFVIEQRRRGFISRETLDAFGERHLTRILAEENTDYAKVVSLLINYGLDPRKYREAHGSQIGAYLQQKFEEGALPDRSAWLIAGTLGEVAWETRWEAYDLDTQTELDTTAETWRDEQTVIDIMQNLLDANDYVTAEKMVRAVYGDEETDRMLKTNTFYIAANTLWRMKEHLPVNEEEYQEYFVGSLSSYKPEMTAEEICQRIEGIEGEIPEVQVLLINEQGEEKWVYYDDLREKREYGWSISGARMSDSGLGYDVTLNAMYAPTKQGLNFLRGRFGQGIKACMLALERENCEIVISSACIDKDTSEIIEWNGKPYVSDETESLHFRGEKRRVFKTGAQTGTTVEIRFDKSKKRGIYADMFNPRIGGLGRYVLEYSQNHFDFIYGHTGSDVQVDRGGARNQIFVQGLEVPVPAKSTKNFFFAYNFNQQTEHNSVLGGRDRKTIVYDRASLMINDFWEKTADEVLVNNFQILALGFPLDTFIEQDSIASFSYSSGVPEEVLSTHRRLLFERLGITAETKGIVIVDKYFKTTSSEAKQLVDLGYVFCPVYDTWRCEQYVEKVSGLPTNDFNKSLKIANGEVEKRMLPEEKVAKVISDTLESARENTANILEKNGFRAQAGKVRKFILSWETVVKGVSDNKLISPNRVYKEDSPGEFVFTLHQDNLWGAKEPLAEISEIQLKQLQLLLEIQLLGISKLEGTGTYINYKMIQRASQEMAILFLTKSLSEEAPEFKAAHEAEVKVLEVKVPDVFSPEQIERDETFIRAYRTRHILDNPEVELADIEKAVGILREIYENGKTISDHTLLTELCGRQYFIGGKFYQIEVESGDDPINKTVKMEKVTSRDLGERDGRKVYLVGEEYEARLVIPFPFGEQERVNLTLGNSSKLFGLNTSSDFNGYYGVSPFETDAAVVFNESELLNKIYVFGNFLTIPIGSAWSEVAERRANYFMEHPEVLILEKPGGVRDVEKNYGTEYIETKFDSEYGRGNVWSDPQRIFGDIIQNHLDEAGIKLRKKFLVSEDGKRRWISEEELLGKYSDRKKYKLYGVSFEDDGRGYTTRQITYIGSRKLDTGERGKFGEGLKMLAASCVRQGFLLNLNSRNFKAAVTKRQGTVVAHGRKRTVNMVGFNMHWGEEQAGSETRIELPEGFNEYNSEGMNTWVSWMGAVDPRNTDALGNRGVERFVRPLRRNEKNVFRVGPVTILLDEPGKIYEKGIIVPETSFSKETPLLFGYDFDGEIITTQERNEVDPDKTYRYLIEAFNRPPYEVVEKVMDNLVLSLRASVGSGDEDSRGAQRKVFKCREYNLLQHVVRQELIREAYLRFFGSGVYLSSKESLSGYAFSSDKKLRDFYQNVLNFEELHFDRDSLLQTPSDLPGVRAALEKAGVKTTETLLKELAAVSDRPYDFEETERVRRLVLVCAQSMEQQIKNMQETEGGSLFMNSVLGIRIGEDGIDIPRNMLAANILGLVSRKEAEIQPVIQSSMTLADGLVSGPMEITLADTIFSNPRRAVEVTKHEIWHIASDLDDYTPEFIAGLLLLTPDFASRYRM